MMNTIGPVLVVFGILLVISLIGLVWHSRIAARLNPSSQDLGMRSSDLREFGAASLGRPSVVAPAYGRDLSGRGTDTLRR